MTMSADIRVRRVYEEPSADDGPRVLVDKLWPRGLSKENAHLDEWAKDIAPSNELRTWYGHDPARFDEFRHRYERELSAPAAKEGIERLRGIADGGKLTLLTATREVNVSHAVVLADLLR
jgi:uncharacterized protein YeaO (DUF488 family)